jgi:uncharacterized protein involved in outer membrane biogenesis
MRKRHKIFLILAGFLGMILILSIALYFSAARLINTDTVKDKLRVYFLEKTGAVVGYGTSEIHLFPLPEIIFHKVDIVIPDEAQGTVESLGVYPGLLPLLRGDLAIARLSLKAPSSPLISPQRRKSLPWRSSKRSCGQSCAMW